MKEILEPEERRRKAPPQRTGYAARSEQPKTHAAHAATQARYDSILNQMNVLIATVVQNQAIQQLQPTIDNTDSEISGLPMPGIY